MGYYENPCDAFVGPTDDDELWETVYPPEGVPESLNCESGSLNECCECEPPRMPHCRARDAVREGKVAGEGGADDVIEVVVELLKPDCDYGFEFEFWAVEK